jgi:hypothetical protein
MNSLQLISAVRPGGSNKTQRHYLDFLVSGQSLKVILGQKGADLVTLFGWGNNKEYEKHILKVFTLQDKSELKTGRLMIYVCPECGDIDCGAITASFEDLGDRIVWKDFGYETDYGGLSEEYSDIEPIEFDRQSYFDAFSKL